MRNDPFEIRPLTPGIGAEIHGVDLCTPLDDVTHERIHKALLDHLVVFFGLAIGVDKAQNCQKIIKISKNDDFGEPSEDPPNILVGSLKVIRN